MITVDDETLQMYIEEARDHLADIENDLLTIEGAGADINEDLVNKVFRAAHSIKGGAGFMGLNNIKELAHRLENVLGMIRSREMVPTPGIVSVLLKGFDKLREMIEDSSNSETVDTSFERAALQAVSEGQAPETSGMTLPAVVDIANADGRTIFSVSQTELDQSLKGGKFLYLLEFDLLHDLGAERTPLDLMRDVRDGGAIIECKIDLFAVGSLSDDLSPKLPLWALHATVIDWDLISAIYGLPEERILRIEYKPGSKEPALTKRKGDYAAAVEVELELPPSAMSDIAPKPAQAPAAAAKPAAPAPPTSKAPEAAKPAAKAEGADTPKAAAPQAETSLRVHISLLDNLMTLAGELVLGRNQLLQAKQSHDEQAFDAVCQRIDSITSELQETIMLTRMQPIGNIFNKFPRVVRDLSQSLGKDVELKIEGREVELDKTIIEGLNDPLTHLVRNSVDHGIESPEERRASGKPATGTVELVAYHEAGQVNIEIIDDGKGIDPQKLGQVALRKGLITEEQLRLMTDDEKTALILLPGFSTAEKVTDVSGRGVGMDVVKTNLDKLGGLIQIDSTVGKGTTIRIKLPLTLAIIPTQIITSGGQRFAIPQVNMDELLRIPAAQVKDRIEIVGDAEVVRLRGKLLPLIVLSDILSITKKISDPSTGEPIPDRRSRLSDRRSRMSAAAIQGESGGASDGDGFDGIEIDTRKKTDRRYRAASAVNIVVVTTGPLKYGLVVDELGDAEEIVVKPLGRHLKRCRGYAGATIMGDGRVSLIVDVASIAHMAQLASLDRTERAAEVAREEDSRKRADQHSLVLFRNAPDEQFAVPVGLVLRIEKIKASQIETLGGSRVVQYRGGSLPLFTIDQVANVKPLPEAPEYIVLVFTLANREIGLLARGPVDATDISLQVDTSTLRQPGISGSAIIDKITTMMLDIYELVETVHPDWFVRHEAVEKRSGGAVRILFAEDSDFFRTQIMNFLTNDGFEVKAVIDGRDAWDHLEAHGKDVDILVTDIEMPRMDGFELVRRMRDDKRFAKMQVVAVTTRASDEDVATGAQLGIEEYQIKLDKEHLLEAVHRAAAKAVGR